MNLQPLIEQANKDGGLLYNPVSQETNPHLGYAVNIAKNQADNPNNLLGFFLNQNKPQEGLWVWLRKEEDGTWTGGYAAYKTRIQDAAVIGMMNGEQTIWDSKAKANLEIPKGQRAGTMTQRNTYAKQRAEKFALQVPQQ